MKVEPIEDEVVDSAELYIADLEAEITSLRKQLDRCNKLLRQKPKQQDKSCCEAYEKIKGNFNKLLDEIIPF